MDNKAQASNPARLPFSFLQYIRCYPAMMLILPAASFVFAIVIGPLKGLSIGVSAGIGLFLALVALPTVATSTKRKLQEGDLCAALVVSISPCTVAVLADLCNDGSGPKLAVKIQKAPLEKMAGGPPKPGEKLSAASTYFGAHGKGAWENFHPMVANCACSDLEQLKRATASIDPNDWIVLKEAMKSLKPTALGLHHIQV